MTSHRKPSRPAVFISGLYIMAASAAFLFAETPLPVTPSTAPVADVTPPVPAPSTPAPVVVKPPAAAPAPGASLEFVGATTCLSCHQGQEHFKDTVHARAFAQLKGIPLEQSCETCHGAGSLHAAAAGDRANPGFATIKNFKGTSAVELEKTCLQCHADENRMHWIGSQHEKRNVSCLACHSVHNAQEDKLLLVKPTVEKVCAQCHKDIVSKIHRNAHMPLPEGKMDCTSCHNPHGSATAKMIKLASVNDTCYSCHADRRGPYLFEHPPVRENCLNCHDPHGTHNEKMLNAREPFLCQRCHAGTRHPSVAYDSIQIGVSNPKSGAESCTNCHVNVHGSNHPSGRFFIR